MDIDQKIWLKSLVADYKKECKTKNITIDKEHEDDFKKLLETLYTSGNTKEEEEEEARKVIQFIVRHFIVRPLVQEIITNCQEKFKNQMDKESINL